MTKYIVVIYNIPIDFCASSVFDIKDEALRFISDNHFIYKKYHEEKNWIFKLIDVDLE